MNNKDKILELSLYYYADVNKALINKILDFDKTNNYGEVMKFLKTKGIDTLNKRMMLIWEIESEIEKIILENIHLSDEILILDKIKNMIVEKYPELDMSEDTFKMFMKNRNFRGINNMRSFDALCEGSIEDCKICSNESSTIVAYSILRTLAILNNYDKTDKTSKKSKETDKTDEIPKSDIITNLTNEIIKNIYGENLNLNVEKIMNLSFRHKVFLLSDYKEYIKTKPALYIDGVLKIIKPYFESNNIMNEYEVLLKAYDELYTLEEKIDENTNEEAISNEDISKEVETNDVEAEYISIGDLVSVDEIEPEIVNSTMILNEDTEDTKVDLAKKEENSLTTLESIKLKAQELLNLANELENTNNNEVEKNIECDDNSNEIINELEKENERLKNEIDILKKRVSDISLKDFIKQAGGREYGYQLSELYMLCEGIIEDDGNIPGRLINLFGILSNYSLEAFTEDKEIGEEFEIDRKTLSQKYMLEMPLKGDDENVKVRMVKNGWKYNNEVIVSPLVRQI